MTTETIIAAAVRLPVGKRFTEKVWRGKRSYPDYVIVSAPPPARHGTILHPLTEYFDNIVPAHDQGFLTSTGRFVDRKEALQIALNANQALIDHPSRSENQLYSEDLW